MNAKTRFSMEIECVEQTNHCLNEFSNIHSAVENFKKEIVED